MKIVKNVFWSVLAATLFASAANAKIYREIVCEATADSRRKLNLQVSDNDYHLGSKMFFISNRGVKSKIMKVTETSFNRGSAAFTAKAGRYEYTMVFSISKLDPDNVPARSFEATLWAKGESTSFHAYKCRVSQF